MRMDERASGQWVVFWIDVAVQMLVEERGEDSYWAQNHEVNALVEGSNGSEGAPGEGFQDIEEKRHAPLSNSTA